MLGCDVESHKRPFHTFSVHTYPGAAVYEGARDLQHVRVLGELQQVPLQLLLVAGHLAELHLQPLELLLNGTWDTSVSLTLQASTGIVGRNC